MHNKDLCCHNVIHKWLTEFAKFETEDMAVIGPNIIAAWPSVGGWFVKTPRLMTLAISNGKAYDLLTMNGWHVNFRNTGESGHHQDPREERSLPLLEGS